MEKSLSKNNKANKKATERCTSTPFLTCPRGPRYFSYAEKINNENNESKISFVEMREGKKRNIKVTTKWTLDISRY